MKSLIREEGYFLTDDASSICNEFDKLLKPFVKKYLDMGYKAGELEYVIIKHIPLAFAGEAMRKRIRDMEQSRPKKKVILVPVELDIAGKDMAKGCWWVVRDAETKNLLGFLPTHSNGPVITGPDRYPCPEFDIEVIDIGD